MNKRKELLEGIEPIIVKETLRPITDKERKIMGSLSCASNLPACGGPIYSNTYWLPEDVEVLLEDIDDNILGN